MSARSQGPSAHDAVVGDALLHPLSLASLVLLLLNDHVLKGRFPGVLTGKLSDVAGMVFFPLVLLGVWQLACKLLRKDIRPRRTSVLACVLLTALVFAATKLSSDAGSAYAHALGALQWPFRALAAALRGAHVAVTPSSHTVDPTDVLAVPFVFVAYAIARPRLASVELEPEARVQN